MITQNIDPEKAAKFFGKAADVYYSQVYQQLHGLAVDGQKVFVTIDDPGTAVPYHYINGSCSIHNGIFEFRSPEAFLHSGCYVGEAKKHMPLQDWLGLEANKLVETVRKQVNQLQHLSTVELQLRYETDPVKDAVIADPREVSLDDGEGCVKKMPPVYFFVQSIPTPYGYPLTYRVNYRIVAAGFPIKDQA